MVCRGDCGHKLPRVSSMRSSRDNRKIWTLSGRKNSEKGTKLKTGKKKLCVLLALK